MNSYKLYLLSQEDQNSNLSFFYDESYKCWHSIWNKTFKELDNEKLVYSDEFLRQEYIASIFDSDKFVALILFHKTNLEREACKKDSYFRAWPKEAVEKLQQDGPNILIGSNITVEEQYRGANNEISFKNIVLELGVQLLLTVNCSVMSGTMRNNKGMNKAAYQTGATLIQENVKFHGVDVDLVGFFKKNILKESIAPSFTARSLWRNRISNIMPFSVSGKKVA